MYDHILAQMKKGLVNLGAWLEKAKAHAAAKRFDPNVLVGMRLAPDQFAFARQVQTACDTLKLATARLSGKTSPPFEDNEATLDALRERIDKTLAWVDTVPASDFAEAGARVVANPRWQGKVMTGGDYFVEHAVPNFYFHLTTAYAILRHSGVELGKQDYLGPLSLRDPA